jgi:catechol 2,3-dioxygenase-like lactoylglutathione lyase family enzyme
MHEHFRRPLLSPTTRGIHHLALCTDDMKATIDFYVEVLGMPLVHAMKVPPGLGTGARQSRLPALRTGASLLLRYGQ